MSNQRAILLVKKLSMANLPILAGLSMIGYDVRYMFYPEFMKNSGSSVVHVKRRLEKWGLHKIDFSDVSELDQYGSLKHSPQFAHDIYNKYFQNIKFDYIFNLFPGVEDRQSKIPILIYDTLIQNIMDIGDLISVVNAYKEQDLHVYVFHPVDRILNQVLSPEMVGVVNLYPAWFGGGKRIVMNLATGVGKVVRKVVSRWGQKKKKGNAEEARGVDTSNDIVSGSQISEVVFFPHQGVAYGTAFLKDHFYDDDIESPLHPSRILHIELHDEPSLEAVQYYADHNIRYTVMPLGLAMDFRDLLNLTKAFFLLLRFASKGMGIADGITVFSLLFKSYSRFFKAYQRTSTLQGTKLALIGYDYLFPTGLSLALQARGIKIAAVQERLVHVFDHYFHPVFDTYFISGGAVRERLQKNPFFWAADTPITGLVRAQQLKIIRKEKVADKEKQVLVLDFHTTADEFSDLFDPLISWDANRNFYEDILRLAEKNLDIQFIIRGKNDAWCSVPYFADVMLKISASPNVSVNRNYVEMGMSYTLAASSDLIIARQTSLCDEALAASIPVLIHDWRAQQSHNVSGVCDYLGYDVYVHSFEALNARFNKIIREGIYLPDGHFKKLQSMLYGEPIDDTKKRILQNLLRMIQN